MLRAAHLVQMAHIVATISLVDIAGINIAFVHGITTQIGKPGFDITLRDNHDDWFLPRSLLHALRLTLSVQAGNALRYRQEVRIGAHDQGGISARSNRSQLVWISLTHPLFAGALSRWGDFFSNLMGLPSTPLERLPRS